ncbi:AAA family ATPase [Zavarzinia sp.]|uniref:AAA family ATPase n=1 Tax=Zavarzinia sp. TaxID=2027920 RepID=UPI0035624469
MGLPALKLARGAEAVERPPLPQTMPSAKDVLELVRSRVQHTTLDRPYDPSDPRPAKKTAALSIGVHEGTLGRYLDGKAEPSEDFRRLAWTWLTLEEARELDEAEGRAAPRIAGAAEPLAETTVVRRVERLCKLCLQERIIGMVYSETSCGKTTALKAYAAGNPAAIYVKASVVRTSTKRGMMASIWKGAARRGKDRSLSDRWDDLIEYLAGGDPSRPSTRLIIVDDAHVLPYAVLEALRDLHDEAGVGIVLAGTTRLHSRVTLAGDAHQMFEQLRARIGVVRRVGKPDRPDVEAVARAWAPPGLEFTAEALEWLADLAKQLGALRLVKHHVRMALRIGGADRVNGTLDVRHLQAAHRQLDSEVAG